MEIFNNAIISLNNLCQQINKDYLSKLDKKVAYSAIEPFMALGVAFSSAVILSYFIHNYVTDPINKED